jgi:hypothetical protein
LTAYRLTSNGGTSIEILQDIAALLAAVDTDADSRLFLLMNADSAKFLTAKTTSTGELAFPGMTPNGGTLAGMRVLVTDAAGLNVILVDAKQLACAAGDIALDTARAATLQFDSAPDSPSSAATTLVSLFHENKVALRGKIFRL